ncbi:MAG: hypothetical protein KC503_29850 [Myxococcales bacterium]|nr:hypothetical protein [Myxococcales bacterium]
MRDARLRGGEPWAERALERVSENPAWAELFAIGARAASASKPTRALREAMAPHVAAIGRAALERELSQWMAIADALPDELLRQSFVVMEHNAALLRGVIWALDDTASEAALDALAQGARCFGRKVRFRGQRSTRVTNACLRALADNGSDAAIARLIALGWQIEYPSTQQLVERLLAQAAKDRGVAREALADHLARGATTRDVDEGALERALRSARDLVRREPAAALEPLLALWRGCRDARLAAAIEALSAQLTAPERVEALRKRSQKATLAAWCERCARGDAAELGVLLSLFPLGNFKACLAQVEALAAHYRAADPRLAAALLSLVTQPKYESAASRALYGAIFDGLLVHADPRSAAAVGDDDVVDRLVTAAQSYKLRGFLEAAIPRLRAALAAKLAALPSALPPSLDELVAAVAPSQGADDIDAAELLEAIYAAPHDDNLRRVYADAATARGDPHGELVALQLLPELTREQRRRERELLRTYGRAWLGPLEPLLQKQGLVYRRGFVAEGRLRAQSNVERAAGDARWSTFEVLDAAGCFVSSLFEQPQMKHLRELRGLSVHDADAVCIAPEALSLRSLSFSPQVWEGWWFPDGQAQLLEVQRAFDRSEVLSSLAHLRVNFGLGVQPALLFDWRFTERLERLAAGVDQRDAHRFIEQAFARRRAVQLCVASDGYESTQIVIEVAAAANAMALRFALPPLASKQPIAEAEARGALQCATAVARRLDAALPIASAAVTARSERELSAARAAAPTLARALRGRAELRFERAATA